MGRLNSELKISIGEMVSYQGQNFEIKQLTGGLKSVILKYLDSESIILAEIKDLLPFIEKTPVLGLVVANDSKKVKQLESISDEDWIIAQKRLAIIRPVLNNMGDGQLLKTISEENNVDKATIYRWIQNFEKNGQVSSLIREKSDGGKGKSRLTPEMESIIKAAIEEQYLSKQKNPISKVCHEVVKRCKNIKVTPPHINTIRNRILSLSEETRMRAREGNKIANDKFNPIRQEYQANYPLEIVQIDHTQLDIVLVNETNRKSIGRPWLTAAIDVYSRVIVGFYLSFDPPGALGTGMCIANAILPKEGWLQSLDIKGDWLCWGRMNTIHADNAKEFRGRMLSRACEEYGINLEWRPVKNPKWGGHIERLMGTISREIHNLRGTTRSNPKDRGEYDSIKEAVFTLKDFETWFVEFIVNVYHVSLHKGIGTTPMSKFEEGLNKTGLPPRILNENKVRLDFLPYVERSIQEYGVLINHFYYYGDVLRKWINALIPNTLKSKQKRMFIFKRDPRDRTVVFFYDPDLQEYFQIPCRNTTRDPMTDWEYNEVLKWLKSDGVSNIDEDAIFEARERLNKIEEEAITKTRIERKTKKDAKIIHSLQKSFKLNPTGTNPTINEIKGAESLKPRIDFSNIKPFEEAEYESFE